MILLPVSLSDLARLRFPYLEPIQSTIFLSSARLSPSLFTLILYKKADEAIRMMELSKSNISCYYLTGFGYECIKTPHFFTATIFSSIFAYEKILSLVFISTKSGDNIFVDFLYVRRSCLTLTD